LKSLVAGSVALILCATGLTSAHHSATGIDRSKKITVEGTVKEFRWVSPHAWLEVEVPNGKGGAALYNFEMTPPQVLVRAGWKSSTLKFGDKVKVTGRPFKNGDPGGLFLNVTLPSGQVMTDQEPARNQ
jgi:hypothetical protein